MNRLTGNTKGHIGYNFRHVLAGKSSFSVKKTIGQNTEKPCVAGSIPALSTVFCPKISFSYGI